MSQRFCPSCDYSIDSDELLALVCSPDHVLCPRCQQSTLGSFYAFGSATHKKRRDLFENGQVRGAPLPIVPEIDNGKPWRSCPMCEQVHCICNEDRWSKETPHPAEYIYGMAPRTDAADQGTANLNPRHAYIIMRAHARALEIELRESQKVEVTGR